MTNPSTPNPKEEPPIPIKLEPKDEKPQSNTVNIHPVATADDQPTAISVVPNSSSEGGDQPSPYPTGLPFFLTIATLCSSLVLVSLDGSIVATAVPAITDHFRTVQDVGWYSSAFRLTICAFQFVFGKAYTTFPVKTVYLFSNAVSILGFLLCATAQSSSMLVVGRAVAGLGGSGLVAGCFRILVGTMELRRRPFYIGVLCGVESIAIISAPLLGGWITQTLGWRWCFYVTVPLGAGTFGLAVFCVRDGARERGNSGDGRSLGRRLLELDPVSNVLFLAALTCLFLALSWAGTKYPWSSAAIIVPLAVSGVLLVAFYLNQRRLGDSAALVLRIAGQRSVLSGAVYIACTNAAIVVLEYYLPTYYQVVRGYSPARSGTMMLPIIIAAAIANLILGWGISATGYYASFMIFSSVIMPVAAGLITTFSSETSLAKMILCTAFSGFANGIGFSGPQTAPQAVLPEQDVSMGLSVVLFAQSFGPAVGVAVAQVLFANQLVRNLGPLLPGFNAKSIEDVGLKQIVAEAPIGIMADVVEGVNKSITRTWYLAVGLACATMIGSALIEWKSVKERQTESDEGV